MITLALLVLYWVLRLIAGNCTGAACDWFIPVSLLLPVAILVLVAITGLSTWSEASRVKASTAWPVAMAALTLIGIAGPIVALILFRDSPDRFVPIASVLTAIVPLAALAYTILPSVTARRP